VYRRNDSGSQHDYFASMGRVDATKLDLPSKKLDRKCKFYGVFVNCTQFFKSHFSILSNLCFFYAHKSCEKIFECIFAVLLCMDYGILAKYVYRERLLLCCC
jgi:hypothetical protein